MYFPISFANTHATSNGSEYSEEPTKLQEQRMQNDNFLNTNIFCVVSFKYLAQGYVETALHI